MGLAGTNPFKREPQAPEDQGRVLAAITGLMHLLPWSQRPADRGRPTDKPA